MWRPDRSVRGPEHATLRDVDPLNRVFAEAFTDRYSRDGLVGVRVPQLNSAIWRYAIEDAGDDFVTVTTGGAGRLQGNHQGCRSVSIDGGRGQPIVRRR